MMLQYPCEQKHGSRWGSPVWMDRSPLVTCFWFCFLKKKQDQDGGECAGCRTASQSQEVQKYTVVLVPGLSQQHLPTAAGLPTGVEGVGELCFSPCLYTAVFGLATKFYHTRVRVVIQSGKNFPECLEKPETLNGFQGLLMWLVQEIAVRQ